MLVILTILFVFLDQISKYLSVKYLKGRGPIRIIDNFFNLYYLENRGAAFGILQEKRILFLVLTSIIILGLVIFIYRNHRKLNVLNKLALSLLLAGAIGNYIDRFRFGYVIDFLSLKLFNSYNFPVFNLADVFIVVSTLMIMLMVVLDNGEIRW